MNAYQPRNLDFAAPTLLVLMGVLLGGLLLTKWRSVRLALCVAWLVVVLATAGVDLLTASEPAGVRMVALIAALLWSLKAVVTVSAQADGQPRLRPGRWLGFAIMWPGMRPAPFAAAPRPPLSGAACLLTTGLQNLAVGLALIVAARSVRLTSTNWLSANSARIVATLLLLPGLSFVLHFGLCNLIAGAWRMAGVECRSLFRAPLGAPNLQVFWGRRWNIAFAEMTALVVYRPLARRFGAGPATAASFLFSGLLHEVAISVPVGAGYGLPLLYFALHGLLVLTERWLERQGMPILRWGWLAHVWTLGWLAVPLPILFHPYFLQGVVWPLVGIE